MDDCSSKNVTDFIKCSCHYFPQTLPPPIETDRPAGKCEPFLSTGSEQRMNYELHMPFSVRTQAIHYANMVTVPQQ